MAVKRITTRLLATATMWAGFGLTASAQLPAVTVEKAMETKPRQQGVTISTPTPAEFGRCRVEPIANPKVAGQNMGYVVRDPAGRPVRQFVSYDNKSFNIVAFYIDGLEAYREVYPPKSDEPHQFRWLGANGGKWGLDKDRDGRVDEWIVISPEEVSQELLLAVLSRDAKRLEALLPSKENLESLSLPAAEATRIRDKAASAAKKLMAAADGLKLSPNAKWIHLELGLPQTTAADSFGGRDDLIVHKNGIVLIQDGDKAHFLQTGEMVLVARSWKLIEGPTAGPGGLIPTPESPGGGFVPLVVPAAKGFVEQLDKLDKGVGSASPPPTQAELIAYYGKRAALLEEIIQVTPADKQAEWVKILIDSLTAAAEGEKAEGKSVSRLRQLKEALGKGGAQNPLAAYAAFRVLVAENAIAHAEPKPNIAALQEKWRAGLEDYVKVYATADDAPEAVLRLAMSFEFVRKEGEAKESEAKAKQWYEYLTKNYAAHPHAAKAAGSIRRLECEGKTLDIQGTSVTTGQPFVPGHVLGKVVVVYYWASWSSSLADDVKKLKDLKTTYGPKGLEIVTVCLDDDAKQAAAAANALQLPATHLHSPGGLDRSPLAAGYGIHVAPHLFVVGKDCKVVNRNAQMVNVEDDIKKLTGP